MKIDKLTPDAAILRELGTRLARVRKQSGYSQDALAREAGLGVATLRRIEAGEGSQMESWLKLLKALDRVDSVDRFLPEHHVSPMAEVSATRPRRPRSRASAKRWGDERE